ARRTDIFPEIVASRRVSARIEREARDGGDPMNEPSGSDFNRLDLDLARRIDAACRRFEVDWRAGKGPAVDDYLEEVPDAGRAAPRDELMALERELRGIEEGPTGSVTAPPSTVAEAPAFAPSRPPTESIPRTTPSSPGEEATAGPRDDATV